MYSIHNLSMYKGKDIGNNNNYAFKSSDIYTMISNIHFFYLIVHYF